jgi:transcriptional regulator with XRE-family HTH domain
MERAGRHIPNRLRKHRRLMGYRQRDVIKLLGHKDANRLSRWEAGLALPSTINLIKLSIIYRTLPSELYFDLLLELREQIKHREQKHFPKEQRT